MEDSKHVLHIFPENQIAIELTEKLKMTNIENKK